MASYAEELIADPPRLRAGLEGLIAEQQATLRRLYDELPITRGVLDRVVLRLILYGQHFGRGASETTLVQREAEDASTRLIVLQQKIEKQEGVLQMYQAKLAELNSGGSLFPPAVAEQVAQTLEQ